MACFVCMLIFAASTNKRGMTVSSGSVVIKKDQSNLIGISIGGGAPYCPCLYIVQVMINQPNIFFATNYFAFYLQPFPNIIP